MDTGSMLTGSVGSQTAIARRKRIDADDLGYAESAYSRLTEAANDHAPILTEHHLAIGPVGQRLQNPGWFSGNTSVSSPTPPPRIDHRDRLDQPARRLGIGRGHDGVVAGFPQGLNMSKDRCYPPEISLAGHERYTISCVMASRCHNQAGDNQGWKVIAAVRSCRERPIGYTLSEAGIGCKLGKQGSQAQVAGIVMGQEKRFAVDVSAGELVDKITILEIKADFFHDPEKLLHVRQELELLKAVRDQAIAPTAEIAEATVASWRRSTAISGKSKTLSAFAKKTRISGLDSSSWRARSTARTTDAAS